MTVIARWSGAGLPAGQTLTTSLAGDGDAAFTATSVTGTAVTATGGPGPSGVRLSYTPSGAACYAEWGAAVAGSLSAMAVRVYYRFSAWPSASFTILRGVSSSGAQQWGVDLGGIGSPGQVRLRNAANSANVATSPSSTITVGADLRFEVLWDTFGATSVYAYTGHGATPLAALTGNTGGTTAVAAVRFGPISGTTVGQFYASDYALADTATLIGPVQAQASTALRGLWDGSALQPVALRGLWDGGQVLPAALM